MPKMSKKKTEEKNLTVIAKLFETLRSKQFQNHFFWDVLSELKGKPLFKRVSDEVKELLNKQMDALETLPVNQYNIDDQKIIVNQLCTMAYIVDTFCSKILFKRLEKVFESHIRDIINAMRNEGKIPDDVWNEIDISNISFEKNIKESMNSTKNTAVPKETASPVATSTPKTQLPEKSNSNNDKEIEIDAGNSFLNENQEVSIKSKPVSLKKGKQKVTREKDKKLKNKKNAPKNDTEEAKELPQNKMETRSHAVRKKIASLVAIRKRKLPERSNSKNNKEIKAEVDLINDKQDGDADSVISFGHVSLASVSSVHTSDLSSFDDEVSVSSGDEGTRRRISLKELVEEKVAGKLNGFKKKIRKSKRRHQKSSLANSEAQGRQSHHSNVNENSTAQESFSNAMLQISQVQASVQSVDKEAESAFSELLSPNLSSKRVRKPNSKYSSDIVICQSMKIKDKKKFNVSTTNVDEKLSSENLPQKRRISDTQPETPSKVQKMDAVSENNSSDDKNTPKENKSTDLPKPVSIVRPLTSRRTAPLTLFSSKP